MKVPATTRLVNPCRQRLSVALLLCSFVSGVAVLAVAAPVRAATTADEIPLLIAIPGMPKTNCTKPENKGKTCVASFGEYIQYFYQFFSGVVGIIAAVMVAYGGYQWLTASGRAGQVQQAKTTIYSALIAIVLVFVTYLILYTVNPSLVNLKLRGVTDIASIALSQPICGDNPKELKVYDSKGCDPRSKDCSSHKKGNCGDLFTVENPNAQGETTNCIATDCPKPDEICSQKGNTYKCVAVRDYCENADWYKQTCNSVDVAMLKSVTPGTQKSKFTTTSCGANGGQSCQWGYLLTHVTSSPQLSHDIGLDDYDLIPVNCFLPEAENDCWKKDEKTGQQKVLNCDGESAPCTNFSSRQNVGQGMCLHVKNATSSISEKGDYKCFVKYRSAYTLQSPL